MDRIISLSLLVCLLWTNGLAAAPARIEPATVRLSEYPQSSEDNEMPTRLVVRTQERGIFGWMGKPANETLARSMDETPRVEAQWVRSIDDFQVFDLGKSINKEEYGQIAARLASMDGVVSVEPDVFIRPDETVPNDPYMADSTTSSVFQFYLKKDGYFYGSESYPYWGMNALDAWDITTGDSDLRIAVLDSGIINHPDLDGRWVGGYDFVSSDTYSGDGDGGWDADPHDTSYNTSYTNSRWHGAHVTGSIAASSNNNYGIAGLNWNSKVVPVRVLGWGGGSLSDTMAGLEWAAGFSVSGAPANPNPAKVFSLSLGGGSSYCPTFIQSSIDKVYAAGGIIVVAAGNNSADIQNTTPANCNHVIVVAAAKTYSSLDLDTSYSNYGAGVTISAPGTMVYSTTYSATSSSDFTPQITVKSGTSMATPHVSGVVSLMLSVKPDLTFDQIVSTLKSTARQFPPGSWCAANAGMCGGGLIDAYQAVWAARHWGEPTLTPAAPTSTPYTFTPTSIPPTSTLTPLPPVLTPTTYAPTATQTATPLPPTATSVPPSVTPEPSPTATPLPIQVFPTELDLKTSSDLVLSGASFGQNVQAELISAVTGAFVCELKSVTLAENQLRIHIDSNSLPNGSYQVKVSWEADGWTISAVTLQVITASGGTNRIFMPVVVK